MVFLVILIFLFKYKWKNLKDFVLGINLVIIVILAAFGVYSISQFKAKEYMQFYESAKPTIEGVYEFKITKLRATYILLEHLNYHDFSYKIWVSRSLILNKKGVIEGSVIMAYIRATKINHIDDFYYSNKIIYTAKRIDIVQVWGEGIVYSVRKYVFESLDRLGSSGRILKGIVFGFEEYGYLERKDLIEAGIYHFFVASGSNIYLTLGFTFYVFSLIIKNKMLCFLGSIASTVFYCMVVGFDAPLLRALIFAIFSYLFIFYEVKDDLRYCLVCSGLVWICFIFIDFFSTFSLSFKLSMMGFIGTIWISKLMTECLPLKTKNFFIDSVMINLSILFFSFPIFLEYFGVWYMNGIVNNMLMVFLIPFIFYLTFVYLFFDVTIFFVKPIAELFEFVVIYLTSIEPVFWDLRVDKVWVIVYYLIWLIAGKIISYRKLKN
ncbi:MAG: ComEC/Rec2 family competence protein [bacterium]